MNEYVFFLMMQTTAGNNKGREEAVLTVRLMEFTLYEENKTFHKKINICFQMSYVTEFIFHYLCVTWLVGHFSTVPIIVSLGRLTRM